MMSEVDSLDLFPDLHDLQTLVSKNKNIDFSYEEESNDSNEVDLLQLSEDEDLISYLSAPSNTLSVESNADRESRKGGRKGLRERKNSKVNIKERTKEIKHKGEDGSIMKNPSKLKPNTSGNKVVPVIYKVVNSGGQNNNSIQNSGSPTTLLSLEGGEDFRLIKPENTDHPIPKLHPRQYGPLSMSKNAVAARENRLRKKQHFEGLEKKVEVLSTQNNTLKETVSKQEDVIKQLSTEVEYLKRVLANQSTLSALLTNIQKTPGVNFGVGSSLTRKRTHSEISSDKENDGNPMEKYIDESSHQNTHKIARLDHDHDYFTPSKEGTTEETIEEGACQKTEETPSGGICLHVSGKSVSLELCASCSTNASRSPGLDYNYTSRNDGTS